MKVKKLSTRYSVDYSGSNSIFWESKWMNKNGDNIRVSQEFVELYHFFDWEFGGVNVNKEGSIWITDGVNKKEYILVCCYII